MEGRVLQDEFLHREGVCGKWATVGESKPVTVRSSSPST
jgi:hypothetical protein